MVSSCFCRRFAAGARWLAVVGLVAAAALVAALMMSPEAGAQEPAGFACASDAGNLSWSDDGQDRYWVYKSVDDGANYAWIGRTLGATSFTDPAPSVGALYQVHYAGIPRVACSVTAEPNPATQPGPFACVVRAGELAWSDDGQDRYWVYKSVDGVAGYAWIGRTLGATKFVDPNPSPGATYQVHYAGIPRTPCAVGDAIPGVIEAENYVSAVDSKRGNQGLATEFEGDADVWPMLSGDGFVIGDAYSGESTSYTVLVETDGVFQFVISTASDDYKGSLPYPAANEAGSVGLSIDGQEVIVPIGLDAFDGWWAFSDTVLGNFALAAGEHTVTVAWAGGQSNFDKVTVTRVDAEPTQSSSCIFDGAEVLTRLPQPECDALDVLVTAESLPVVGDPCLRVLVRCNDDGTSVIELKAFELRGALPPEIGNLTNLTRLDFDDSYNDGYDDVQYGSILTSLPPEIGNLTNLTYLDLKNSTLETVPAEITNLPNLAELILDGNGLTSLPAEIANLTNLTRLGLANNDLVSLPAEIGGLGSLADLDLSRNALVSLPPEIGGLGNLSELALRENALTSLTPEIGGLGSLADLDLSRNALVSLPAEIGGLGSLTDLDLSRNALVSLPAEIGNLGNLSGLTLSDNALVSLPPEIGNLGNLSELALRENALVSLPAEIGNLDNLGELRLADNALVTLPPEIGNLTNLYLLTLMRNYLSGDITALAELTIPALFISDGPGYNNCLTTTDPDFVDRLNATAENPDWDLCEG